LRPPDFDTERRGMVGFFRISILDVRVLCAIAGALVTLIRLSNPEPARSQVARGELGTQIMSFACSPTGKLMATTGSGGRVTLRALERGWQIERFLDFPGYAKAVAFSSDGRFLAVAGLTPCICVWDTKSPTSEPATTMTVPMPHVTRMVFSPDDRHLAFTNDLDGTIVLWDLLTRRERTVLCHLSPVVSIVFSSDGRWLAGGGRDDYSIILWDIVTGSRRILLKNGLGPIVALAFSPDGALLASASQSEHHVRLWDVATLWERRVIAEQARSVLSIAFSPDGALLATAGNDGILGLWTVTTGQRRAHLEAQATCLRTVAFSPDGRTVVLATEDDDDLRLWNLAELL
jgi:Tol biopolymer transport system component